MSEIDHQSVRESGRELICAASIILVAFYSNSSDWFSRKNENDLHRGHQERYNFSMTFFQLFIPVTSQRNI